MIFLEGKTCAAKADAAKSTSMCVCFMGGHTNDRRSTRLIFSREPQKTQEHGVEELSLCFTRRLSYTE
jgi:hypothetical protein